VSTSSPGGHDTHPAHAAHPAHLAHRAPRDCPVCRERLAVTRLGCSTCGTELSGHFTACPYCGLSDEDLDLLKVFLTSRGNMKEVERYLGVSYPTARLRYAELLSRLGLEDAPVPVDRERVLADLAAGSIGVDEAEALLRR